MSWWVVRSRCTADERGGQAPRKTNEDEAQDVVEDWRLVIIVGRHG